MRIELDPEGALNWLLYYHPVFLAAVMRRQRIQRELRESARFYRKHGPVVKVEPNNGPEKL